MKDLAARPVCAVCGKPVERMTEEQHHEGMLKGRVTFTAYCHGDSQRITVHARDLRGLHFGRAFVSSPRRLTSLNA